MSKKAELISNYFATIYLTVISLLQSIALSQLVPIIIVYMQTTEHPWTDVHLLPLLLMLLIIFIVWHHYAIGIFFLRWFPNIIDTIIPFMVSIGQFFLISFLTIKSTTDSMQIEIWTKGFAVFLVTGSVAYFGAAWRLDPELFTNIMTRQAADRHGRYVRRYYSLAGCSILVQGLFAFLIALIHTEQLLLFSLIFMLIHLIVTEYALTKTIQPHFIKAMDEYEE